MNNCYNIGEVLGQNTAGITRISNSRVTANIDNVYYLNSISNVGVLDLSKETDVQNPVYDTATSLDEQRMKSQTFVDELNKNLLDINTQYNLRKWRYVEGSYPEFE